MKFINFSLFLILLLSSCNRKERTRISDIYPPYKLINVLSEKIKSETDLVLCGYGINFALPKGYQYKNGIGNFTASYFLFRKKNDEITLDQSRKLLIFVVENMLKEINSNADVIPDLDVFPFTSDLLDIDIHFKDENKIDLGQGVAYIYFANGKIKYKGYEIQEYTGQFPAKGVHFVMHEETYVEALDIVKKQGAFDLAHFSL